MGDDGTRVEILIREDELPAELREQMQEKKAEMIEELSRRWGLTKQP
jgi:hypothetical protein